MDISVVVPLYNEAESLPELAEWIERVMDENGFSYEVLFINDGSTDNSWEVIKGLHDKNPRMKGISFRRNYGKSPALNTGFANARGNVIITMDADLQDSPDEIPELYRMITKEGYDLVSGWKKKRYDPLSKTIPTKLFNATARRVSGIHNLHDFNCGLKAYRSEVVKHIEVYGDMHRYVPYLAKIAGFTRIGEKEVKHQARKYGTTKFGLDRFVNGYLDLLTLWFQAKFGVKPMHFFGLLGSLMFLLGFIAVIVVGALKLYHMHSGHSYTLVTNSPYFYLALTSMLLGTQLFLSGFLGELIIRHSNDRNHYEIGDAIVDDSTATDVVALGTRQRVNELPATDQVRKEIPIQAQ
jgi:glycosyltransferase involved in cell wall biosynthesis